MPTEMRRSEYDDKDSVLVNIWQGLEEAGAHAHQAGEFAVHVAETVIDALDGDSDDDDNLCATHGAAVSTTPSLRKVVPAETLA